MDLKQLSQSFSICKVKDFKEVDLNNQFVFVSHTDRECSVICPTEIVPRECIEVEHGWNCFYIAEDAAFSKYGMIAFLADIIAKQKTGILVVATYDTDYILIKEEKWEEVKTALYESGCRFVE
nr:ACT domain-containing protein [uncultured Niameybacter sp.]